MDAHGLRGAVRVHPFADDPGTWAAMPYWWLGREEPSHDPWRQIKVIACREQSGMLVVSLEGVDDRNSAEILQGSMVGAPRNALPVPPENEYYWADLIGLEVINTHGLSLGKVHRLIETTANDVLCVEAEEGKERLLPFVASVVLDVNFPEQRITVDWEADW